MTYELINATTSNTLASFTSEAEARSALERFKESDERFAATLMLVAFDDEGLAVDMTASTEPAVEAFSSSARPARS
jgi:hypothetical protein